MFKACKGADATATVWINQEKNTNKYIPVKTSPTISAIAAKLKAVYTDAAMVVQ